MKRKFSFNRQPALAGKPDDKPTPEPVPVPASVPVPAGVQLSARSHHRHDSRDSKESRESRDGICDNSPFINRRVLDAQTERELRVACRVILQNFKPSDYGTEDTDPKLDFGAMDRRADRARKQQPSTDVHVRMPTGAPVVLSPFPTTTKFPKPRAREKENTDRDAPAPAPARSQSTRKPRDFGWLDERDDRRNEKLRAYGKSPSIDIPRSAAYRNDSDEDVSLPVTMLSTLATSKVASTAPTSASLPSGIHSNRRSSQLDNAAIADAAASEWMRQERPKFDQYEPVRPPTAVRTVSRSTSIRENIRDFVFPGRTSRALSRAQSTDSLRTAATEDSEGLQRTGSRAGRRLRGVARKLSSRSSSRPGTSRGDDADASKKSDAKEVNLNRELPPLPSLDSWRDFDSFAMEKEVSPKTPVATGHIASLMRAQEERQHEQRSPAAQNPHRRSGSDSLAMQFNQTFPARQSQRNQADVAASPRTKKSGPSSPVNMSHADSRIPPVSPQHGLSKSSPALTWPRAGDANRKPSSVSKNSDPTNMSRKMSLDVPAKTDMSGDVKGTRKEEQKSRLKKVFSGWMTKKEKKDGMVNRMDKEGIKEGVLVHEGTTPSGVRYC